MPLAVIDLASVETYLLAQPLTGLVVELDGALWCPLVSGPTELDKDREAARHAAASIELPLTFPDRYPAPLPRATRIAALASNLGQGAAVVYAMTRLAFAGGADLDYPEGYEPAIAESSITTQEASLAVEQGAYWDTELLTLRSELRALGIDRAPALRWKGELHLGIEAIARLLIVESPSAQLPLDLP